MSIYKVDLVVVSTSNKPEPHSLINEKGGKFVAMTSHIINVFIAYQHGSTGVLYSGYVTRQTHRSLPHYP